MWAKKAIAIGAALALIGVLIALGWGDDAPEAARRVAWVAAALGAAAVAFGAAGVVAPRFLAPTSDLPSAARADTQLVVRAMLAVAAADGVLDDGEVQIIRDITRALFGSPIDRGEIQRAVEAALDSADATAELDHLAVHTSETGRELALKAALMVAMADGEFHDAEEVETRRIARALGVGEARFEAVLAEARDWSTPPAA